MKVSNTIFSGRGICVYKAPSVERLDIVVEKGFALSKKEGGIELPGYGYEDGDDF